MLALVLAAAAATSAASVDGRKSADTPYAVIRKVNPRHQTLVTDSRLRHRPCWVTQSVNATLLTGPGTGLATDRCERIIDQGVPVLICRTPSDAGVSQRSRPP